MFSKLRLRLMFVWILQPLLLSDNNNFLYSEIAIQRVTQTQLPASHHQREASAFLEKNKPTRPPLLFLVVFWWKHTMLIYSSSWDSMCGFHSRSLRLELHIEDDCWESPFVTVKAACCSGFAQRKHLQRVTHLQGTLCCPFHTDELLPSKEDCDFVLNIFTSGYCLNAPLGKAWQKGM